jgi:hypothetical protein
MQRWWWWNERVHDLLLLLYIGSNSLAIRTLSRKAAIHVWYVLFVRNEILVNGRKKKKGERKAERKTWEKRRYIRRWCCVLFNNYFYFILFFFRQPPGLISFVSQFHDVVCSPFFSLSSHQLMHAAHIGRIWCRKCY